MSIQHSNTKKSKKQGLYYNWTVANTANSDEAFYNKLLLATMFILGYVTKIFQYTFLSITYFTNSYHILSIMQDQNLTFSIFNDGFNNTAFFFKSINFLRLSTLLDWSIFLTVVFNVIFAGYLLKTKIKNSFEFIMAYFFLGAMNIYVLNLSKEFIQFIIFLLIYFSVKSNCHKTVRIILVCGVFMLESQFFREYYILTACFFLALCILMPKILQRKQGFKDIVKLIVLGFAGLYIFLVLCEMIMPSEYQTLVNVRAGFMFTYRNARTLIENYIASSSDSKLLFLLNYFINFIRVLFPFELITKGVYYWPFCIFQFLCTYKLIQNIIGYKSLADTDKIYMNIMIAYYITSVFFEPDFGTFIRHEIATAPVLFELMLTNLKKNTSVNACFTAKECLM